MGAGNGGGRLCWGKLWLWCGGWWVCPRHSIRGWDEGSPPCVETLVKLLSVVTGEWRSCAQWIHKTREDVRKFRDHWKNPARYQRCHTSILALKKATEWLTCDLKSRVGSNAKSTQKMHTAPCVFLVKYRISINKSNPMSIWKKKNENLSKISPKNVIVLPNGQHALSNTVIPWAKSQCWR